MKTKPKKPKLETFSFRADIKKMKLAHKHHINLGDVFRHALDWEIMKKNGRCPTCGGKFKSNSERWAECPG